MERVYCTRTFIDTCFHVSHTLVKHNSTPMQTAKKKICEMCLKKRTHTHTISLSHTHKRPERRQPRKYVGCKSRELVVVKTKYSERWSKGKSVLTLAGVCGCECECARECVLVLFRYFICLSVRVHA